MAEIKEIEVPIKKVDMLTGVTTKLTLKGGCKGVSVEDKMVYRPHFSLVITEEKYSCNSEFSMVEQLRL
jgi:hypothetical protein